MKISSKYSYWRLFRHWPPANSFLQLAMSKNDINHLFLVTGHIKSWGDIVCRFHQNKPSIRSILFRRTLLLEVVPSCMLCFIDNYIISSRPMVIRISIRFAWKYMEKLPCLNFYSNRRMKFYKTSSYQIEFPYKWKKLFVATLTILVKLFCANIGLLWSVLFPNVTVPPWITIVLSECDLNLFYTYWRRLHTTKHSSGYKWLDYDRRWPRHPSSYMFKTPRVDTS